MFDEDKDKIIQISAVMKAAAEKWMMSDIDVYVAIPDQDTMDNYIVAPVKLAMLSEVPEFGWLGENTIGGDCVLIVAEDDVQRVNKFELTPLKTTANGDVIH